MKIMPCCAGRCDAKQGQLEQPGGDTAQGRAQPEFLKLVSWIFRSSGAELVCKI